MNRLQFLVLLILTLSFVSPILGQQLTLAPSNYNGYNVSCFGGQNGSINLTITGGTSPYSISWSNNATTEDIANLRAGYYRVTVDDADSLTSPVMAEITLNEPLQIGVISNSYVYPNNFNISLHGACNGSIDITPLNGVSPFTYLWTDGVTTQDRSSICSNSYKITVTDNNGCTKISESIVLSQPERSDWQMTGNSGTIPSTNFIGTTDNIDLIFKTNNSEQLRISSEGTTEILGTLKIDTASSDSSRMVYVDMSGKLRVIGPGNPMPAAQFYWDMWGNTINDTQHYIGTNNVQDLVFKTRESFAPPEERMRISKNGSISIGIDATQAGYIFLVDGGKAGFREIYVKSSGSWPDYVFSDDYKLTSMYELEKEIKLQGCLPGMPSAEQIKNEGQNIGEIQRLQQEKIEELVLYLIQLHHSIEQLKKENEILKAKIEN